MFYTLINWNIIGGCNMKQKEIVVTKCNDKLALINFAIYNIEQMRKNGMDNETIKQTLLEQFGFSESLIEQLL